MGRMLKKIAVTGGIASGKTTVCQFFKEFGATVVYADKIVHELIEGDLKEKILHDFKLTDRKDLAKVVFQHPDKLKKLEEILHPKVFEHIEKGYKAAKGNCVVVEIPLLYEIGAEDSYDIVIGVLCDETIAKKRFAKGPEEYERRMQRQMKPKEKSDRAHYTITNNGTLSELREKVMALHKEII